MLGVRTLHETDAANRSGGGKDADQQEHHEHEMLAQQLGLQPLGRHVLPPPGGHDVNEAEGREDQCGGVEIHRIHDHPPVPTGPVSEYSYGIARINNLMQYIILPKALQRKNDII